VIAGIEDQRYAGAAMINPDGTSGTVPPGAAVRETHIRRSFTDEVAPLLVQHCSRCHNPMHTNHAGNYLVTGTRDQLVNDTSGSIAGCAASIRVTPGQRPGRSAWVPRPMSGPPR